VVAGKAAKAEFEGKVGGGVGESVAVANGMEWKRVGRAGGERVEKKARRGDGWMKSDKG